MSRSTIPTSRHHGGLLWLLLLSLSAIVCAASDVQTFKTVSDFRSEVLDSDAVWMVIFYENEMEISQVYKDSATILKGIINVAAVDAELAGMLGVSGLPKIQVFADNKKKPTTHEGLSNDPQALLQFAISAVGKTVEERARRKWYRGDQDQNSSSGSNSGSATSNVVNLNASNFNEKVLDSLDVWMVAFIAPWCGHCKNLLPEWEQAAFLLDGEAKLGVVDATVETTLASEYRVEGYPTIKIFPGGKEKSNMNLDYSGGRTKEDLVRAAMVEVDRSGVPKEIPELTGPEMLKENCEGTNKICLLVALPHILDSTAAGRNKYKETLTAVSKKFRGAAFKILWFEGGAQPDLEQTLELTFGFPAVAALSLDKHVYTTMKGSFSEKGISVFLNGITSGRQTTIPLSKDIEIATVEPWDGLDGVPFEEEPLEDIMGWDDDEDDKGGEL